ncbi:ferredoxin [Rhodobacter lacus]|uniref:Ferredoxin n=1 Tax=Rhodobacter lacus TaxID=1641972 RepID=A0ABW5A530_9RHOB
MVHEGAETVLLLAPDEPGFWPHVTAQPEFADGAKDPLDRWSKRVIGALAAAHGGRAIFPSDGPPYPPVFRWALASGEAFSAPVGMMVHVRMGLMASLRGALALPGALPLPDPAPHPCTECAAPCRTACPVAALGPEGYNTAACHAFLNTAEGANCLSGGCLARRACPLSKSYGRLAEQSAWHMRQFHK